MRQVIFTLLTIVLITPLFAQVTDESNPEKTFPEVAEYEIEEEPTVNKHKDEIYSIVEEMPYFTSCDMANGYRAKKVCGDLNLFKFIYGNLEYPTLAKENGIEGTVVVSFVITTKGKVEDLRLLRDAGGGTGAEAMRIFRLMNDLPKGQSWTPGKHKGELTNVKYNLPVRFSLTKEEKKEENTRKKHSKK